MTNDSPAGGGSDHGRGRSGGGASSAGGGSGRGPGGTGGAGGRGGSGGARGKGGRGGGRQGGGGQGAGKGGRGARSGQAARAPRHPAENETVAELAAPLAKVLQRLPETQRKVLELRMGLVDGHPHDLADTARALGLSLSEARDIEKRAFEHIREAVPLDTLQRFLDR